MSTSQIATNFSHQDFSHSALQTFLQKSLPDLSPKIQSQLEAAISELCQNALEHGSGPDDDITLLLETNPDHLKIQIDDTGNGPEPKSASDLETIKQAQITSHPHFDNPSKKGRGLLIASQSVDELTFHDLENGGIRVNVLKSL